MTGDQIRQWIGESRVNAHTRVRAEGSEQWKPLSEFSEFADVLAGGAPTPAIQPAPAVIPPAAGRDAALHAVNGPAVGLLVTAILGLVSVAFGLAFNILQLTGAHFNMGRMGDPRLQHWVISMGGGAAIVRSIIAAVIGVLILKAALDMQKLKNYQFAFTGSILAMVPILSPCCILGLPFGIWALVVLNRPEVKAQFS